MNEDEAREKIEEMQRRNTGSKLIFIGENQMAAASEDQFTLEELRRRYNRLKTIIVNALVSIDVLLKVGVPFALWKWAIPQDGWMQGIGLASYVILLTIISKTITKVKVQS